MKTLPFLPLCLVLASLSSAQEGALLLQPAATTAQPAAAAPEQPLATQRAQEILVLLQYLQNTMAGINDADTAQAAVAPLMRTHAAIQEWARSCTALHPLSAEEQRAVEERYLPRIKKLNNAIRTQGERLAAAEYYGSRDLLAALMHLAILNQ